MCNFVLNFIFVIFIHVELHRNSMENLRIFLFQTIIVKRIILVVHCFIVAAFAAVLIGLLAAGNDKLEGD